MSATCARRSTVRSGATRSRPCAGWATACGSSDLVARFPIRLRLTLGFALAIAVGARSLAPREESLDHLRHELLIFLPLALLAACFGGYLLTAGALRPVEALRRRVEAVTAGEPAELPVPQSDDEISRLAVTLN